MQRGARASFRVTPAIRAINEDKDEILIMKGLTGAEVLNPGA